MCTNKAWLPSGALTLSLVPCYFVPSRAVWCIWCCCVLQPTQTILLLPERFLLHEKTLTAHVAAVPWLQVDARLGPGLEGLQQLLQESGPNTFDFAFIDADKGGYQAYFDLCLQLVRPGGCIAVDNVLFYGRVVDPSRDDKATVTIRKFNEALAADDRVEFSIVPIGDGVALCRKK